MTQVGSLLERELERFRAEHPRSLELAERAKASLLGGVPMHWMVRWAGGFPVFAQEAHGARFVDVDGNEYVDFCLGDTGAMTGHSPEPDRRGDRGAGRARDHAHAAERGRDLGREELARRFGLPYWQFALTATDANRFAIRIARSVTGRPKILVFNWCYHGTVDETLVTLVDGGSSTAARATSGRRSTRSTDEARRRVQRPRRRSSASSRTATSPCVLAEPALTNIGIVLPEPGYHEALRELTRRRPGRCSSSTRRTRSAPGRAGTPRRTVSSPTS